MKNLFFTTQRYHSKTDHRNGSALLLVLIVVTMMALAAMTFVDYSFSEYQAASIHGRRYQTQAFAESGAEYVRVLVAQDPETLEEAGGLYSNISLFQGIPLNQDNTPAYQGRFSVLSPEQSAGIYSGVRFGLQNESSRLNLNTLLLADIETEGASLKVLLALPGMTEPIANAILDWLDTDEEPRPYGAEKDYYSALMPAAYLPANGPLQSIEQLLLVRGVTPQLLFGADMNRNGIIEPFEQPYTSIEGVENLNGEMNFGWNAYLTIYSAERNLQLDGTEKIDLNMDDLEKLHQELLTFFNQNQASFIIALRQGQADTEDEINAPHLAIDSIEIDFTLEGKEKFKSVLDLIGTLASTIPKNDSSKVTLETLFPDDPDSLGESLYKIMKHLTVNKDKSIIGRLNINQAPRILLLMLPGLESSDVDQIISSRQPEPTSNRPGHAYETWLWEEGILSLEEMKALIPYVTTGGNVYRAQVVGYFEAESPTVRLEIICDATLPNEPAKLLFQEDLLRLGPGYSLSLLGTATKEDETLPR